VKNADLWKKGRLEALFKLRPLFLSPQNSGYARRIFTMEEREAY
jgi:hypothetical protein